LHAGLLDCFLDDQQQYHGQAFIAAKVALHCVALRWVYDVHYIMDTSYIWGSTTRCVRGSCICFMRGGIRAASYPSVLNYKSLRLFLFIHFTMYLYILLYLNA
jgi:hypothetical protein